MNVGQLQTRILARLDSSNGTYYTPAEALAKINEAQRFFVLLTLCLEKTANLALTSTTVVYHLLQQSTHRDFMAPLRISVVSGSRLARARLADLDAVDASWQATAGTPDRYALLGLDLLAINKQPSAGGTSLAITYAHAPLRLKGATETPEIPLEYHSDLIDYAIHALRAKEGGQEFLDTIPLFERFFAAAQKLNRYIRARSLAARYDQLPAELRKVDLSRLLKPSGKAPAQHKPLLVGAA